MIVVELVVTEMDATVSASTVSRRLAWVLDRVGAGAVSARCGVNVAVAVHVWSLCGGRCRCQPAAAARFFATAN